MAKLSALFQFFLCFLLFSLYVPPSVQMPAKPAFARLFSRKELLQQRYATEANANAHHSHSYGKPKSMHTPPRVILERAHNEVDQYFVQIGFGTPSKQIYILLDTATDITWIQCRPCVHCYTPKDPIFNPANSTSYNPLSCDSSYCQELAKSGPAMNCNSTRKTCLYEVKYDDGSSTKGAFATETLMVSDTTIADIPIGCAQRTEGDFDTQASGILGLGLGSTSFISKAEYNDFSYCLAHENSSKQSILEFGSSSPSDGSLVTTPMLFSSRQPWLYFVSLTGISVNKQVVPIPPFDPNTGNGGAILGLGIAVSRFPQEVYNKVRDIFVKEATSFTAVDKADDFFDTCYAPSSQSVADFPTVAFHFGQSIVILPPENVMYNEKNYICFGFAPTKSPFSKIAVHQQKGFRVSFDIHNRVVGFLPGNC